VSKKNKVGGGSRKVGRNKIKCGSYRVGKRREKNKVRKLTKLARKQPNNKQLPAAIKKWKSCL
jgi:hypothetical protein